MKTHTLSHKDIIGLVIIICFFSVLINIYYLFTSVNKTIPIIILILIAIPRFIIIKDPISIAYPFNFLYTFQYNKPFILNVKSIYKNDHLIKENFTQIQSEIRNILKIKSIPTVDNIYGTSNKQIKDKNDGWRIYMIKSGNNIKNNADRIPISLKTILMLYLVLLVYYNHILKYLLILVIISVFIVIKSVLLYQKIEKIVLLPLMIIITIGLKENLLSSMI